MGKLITTKQYLDSNVFLYEKRLESQYTKFLEGNPTFVTYYHINTINSTADSGFMDVENIVGPDSPIRFQKIEAFPIYGFETIKLDLSDEDEGLNTSVEGDGTILPNTIQPIPNDMFVVSYLGNEYVFMITSVEYGTIKSNDFYRISYYMRKGTVGSTLDKQVLESYECVFENIGTDDKCLVQSDMVGVINTLTDWCETISEKYKTLFYNSRFNSFIFMDDNTPIYDKYLTHFINTHKLFTDKNSYNTLYMANEDYSRWFDIEYDISVFRLLEDQNVNDLEYIRALRTHVSYADSVFNYYRVENLKSIWFVPTGDFTYLPDDFISRIKACAITDKTTALEEVIINQFNNKYTNLTQIDVSKLSSYKLRYNFFDFLAIPMVLYCVTKQISDYMSNSSTQ